MTDVVSPSTRSRMMAGVRSTNTKPELLVRSALHRRGLRFSRSPRGLPGRPDAVLPHWKVAVFVNGCFWHLHGCKLSKLPSSNSEFWKAKLRANRARDIRNVRELLRSGWRVLIVWECSLRGASATRDFDQTADLMAHWIRDLRARCCCDVSHLGIDYRDNIDESN